MMIRIPDAIMINDDVLFEAMRTLSPVGFKVYMYVYHSWFFYQEHGHGYASDILRDLKYALQIDYEEIAGGFVEIRKKGYIDGLVILDDERKDRIDFRWRVDDDDYADRISVGHDIEDYMDFRKIDALVVGAEVIREPGEEEKKKPKQKRGKHWQKIRKDALERDGHACAECGEKADLHVHHLTYENEGAERLEDLITLCRGCHAKKPKRKAREEVI